MANTVTIDTSADVVEFLKAQHEQIKAGFQLVITSTGSERQAAFDDLRRLLAVHETAEEEVVHPRARHEIKDGDTVVEARLKEESEAKDVLKKLESMDVESTEFETSLRKFQSDVIAHAEAEETQEFAQLAAELDSDQLDRMRRAVELAEKVAPTRPHAAGESATANLLVGPFAAMLDRARDAIAGVGSKK